MVSSEYSVHQYQDLIHLFHQCFAAEYNTQLVKGEDEPIYLPADDTRPYHAIMFAHGFFSSALHECAHWFIAGEERRKQVDLGYWYTPDGRTAEQQKVFQQVEIKPQALEWILSKACGHRFRVSIDNLNGEEGDTEAFKQAVYQQVQEYCQKGLPLRANRFHHALSTFYKQPLELNASHFSIAEL